MATNARTAVAGLAAAIVAGAQIAGGLLVPHVGRIFRRRTSVLLAGTALSAVILAIDRARSATSGWPSRCSCRGG